MKLYYFPGSCALAPHIVLEWLGADYEAVRVEKGDPEFTRINPLGVVPALAVGERVLTQADAILHYLARLYPDAGLGGDGTPLGEYELNLWMAFLTGDLHPAFFPFFGPQRYTVAEDASALAAVKAAGEQRVAHYYRHLEQHLQDREYMVGDRRSIADAYAIPMLRWGRLLEHPLARYEALHAYLVRWEREPGVHEALRQQGLAKQVTGQTGSAQS